MLRHFTIVPPFSLVHTDMTVPTSTLWIKNMNDMNDMGYGELGFANEKYVIVNDFYFDLDITRSQCIDHICLSNNINAQIETDCN